MSVPPSARGGSSSGGALGAVQAPAPQAPSGAPGHVPHPRAPERRPAWREQLDKLTDAATTEPGRLRIIGAVIVVLVLLFGALTAWQIADRQSAARDVVEHSQPLSADAADIYRFLADADATAANGFLAGGQEPRETRDRYAKDIERASTLLAEAAADTKDSSAGQKQIALLNRQLPVYTGLVESARANNRQGLPLGGAYLRYASEQMRTKLLPAAEKLYEVETARLSEDYEDARAFPWAAVALGIMAVGGLALAQRRMYLRTNRVFNVGLLGTTAATAVVLLWLVVGHSVARSGLGDSQTGGAQSLQVLNEARIGALKARGDENLTLVARGAGKTYEDSYKTGMDALSKEGSGSRGDGLLSEALQRADDDEGRAPVQEALDSLKDWKSLHADARASDNSGNYEDALAKVIGGKDQSGRVITDTTGKAFDSVDENLSEAVRHEQDQFEQAANDGRGALTGLSIGAAILAVLASAAAVLGIGRRLSEYR